MGMGAWEGGKSLKLHWYFSGDEDRYLNEELLPAIAEKEAEVIAHRKYTAPYVADLDKEYYRLKLKQHVSRCCLSGPRYRTPDYISRRIRNRCLTYDRCSYPTQAMDGE